MLVTIRSSLFFTVMVIVAVLFAVLFLLIGWFISYEQICKLASYWSRVSLYLLKVICNLGFKVSGHENIPDTA